MEQLVVHVEQVIQREIDSVQDVLVRNDVTLIHGRASFPDSHAVSVATPDGARELHADKCLIAVGTQPGSPRNGSLDDATPLPSDNVLKMKQLPQTMVAVGAGMISIEYASLFAAMGLHVTLVDQRARLPEVLGH